MDEPFPIRSNEYYDVLLRELDDRRSAQPPGVIHAVPPLNLKSSGVSPRVHLAASLTSRPSTGRPGTGRPGTARTTADEALEREARRIEFLCDREAKHSFKSSTKSNYAALRLIKKPKLKGRELQIEHDLCHQFRVNKEKFEALLEKVKAVDEAKEKKKPLSRPNTAKKDTTALFEAYNVSSLSEQIAVVAQRRSTMIEAQNQNLRRMAELWHEKINQHALAQSQVESSYARQRKWIGLLTAVNRFALMGKIVEHAREVKARDIVKWRATRVIQRYWRKFCPSNKRVKKESFIVSLRKSMGAAESHKLLRYQARVNACTVILSFLRNKGFKVAVLQFLWRVKQLQRKFRAHVVANRYRVDIVARLMEVTTPSLLFHIHIVHAGRGLDVRNLTSYEREQMRRHLAEGRNVRLVKQMQTPAFHAFLRANLVKFSFLLRESTAVMLSVNKSWIETAVRRPLLLDVIFKKRRQYSLTFHSHMRLEINIPTVNEDNARAFIRGGRDPISSFLETIAQKERDLVLNHAQRRRKAAKDAAALAMANAEKQCKLVNNTMMFLAQLGAEEVALLVLAVAERTFQILHPPAATGRASTVSGGGAVLANGAADGSGATSPPGNIGGSNAGAAGGARRMSSMPHGSSGSIYHHYNHGSHHNGSHHNGSHHHHGHHGHHSALLGASNSHGPQHLGASMAYHPALTAAAASSAAPHHYQQPIHHAPQHQQQHGGGSHLSLAHPQHTGGVDGGGMGALHSPPSVGIASGARRPSVQQTPHNGNRRPSNALLNLSGGGHGVAAPQHDEHLSRRGSRLSAGGDVPLHIPHAPPGGKEMPHSSTFAQKGRQLSGHGQKW